MRAYLVGIVAPAPLLLLVGLLAFQPACSRLAPPGNAAPRNPGAVPPEMSFLLDLPTIPNYKADPFISAAAKLQGAGKAKAQDALSLLAKVPEYDDQVIVLCRMLFKGKPGEEFRRPMLGGACFLGGTAYEDWPSEPIELVDGVPFLITRGYVLAGKAEPAARYLGYCVRDCDWNGDQFEPKTAQDKQKALLKLLASPKWKTQPDEECRAFLASQIE